MRKINMNKLKYLIGGALAAFFLYDGFANAADLPNVKPLIKATPIAYVVSPFYIFGQAGAGFTNVQNDIALPGLATGSPKLWPAGFMVGGGFGYLSSLGPLSVGVE